MNEFKEFQNYLQADDRSPLTITGYLTDVRLFIAWFEKHNHEPFALESVTPIDVRDIGSICKRNRG